MAEEAPVEGAVQHSSSRGVSVLVPLVLLGSPISLSSLGFSWFFSFSEFSWFFKLVLPVLLFFFLSSTGFPGFACFLFLPVSSSFPYLAHPTVLLLIGCSYVPDCDWLCDHAATLPGCSSTHLQAQEMVMFSYPPGGGVKGTVTLCLPLILSPR